MSHRIAQVESTLKRALAELLARGVADPRVRGLVSVTRVQVSPDLHDAIVFVSVLPEKQAKLTLAGLRNGTRHLHAQLRDKVALRAVPKLDFRLDVKLKKEAAVLDAIRRGMERESPTPPPADKPEPRRVRRKRPAVEAPGTQT